MWVEYMKTYVIHHNMWAYNIFQDVFIKLCHVHNYILYAHKSN